jgi:hypothetical protein
LADSSTNTASPRKPTLRTPHVPVAFADGSEGVVADVVLPALGFDFWAEELAVTAADGRRRVPVRRVRQVDVRPPRILLGSRPPILSPPNGEEAGSRR